MKVVVAAERDARNTFGVEHVYNDVSVEPRILTDDAIAGLVEDGLRSQGLIADHDISVAVENGGATLSGDVDTTIDYWRADRELARSHAPPSDHELYKILNRNFFGALLSIMRTFRSMSATES